MRIKEEALRTYLITYGAHYDSMCLSHLCTTFAMEEATARRIVSRMIFNKEISGAWEHEPSETLVLHKVLFANYLVIFFEISEIISDFLVLFVFIFFKFCRPIFCVFSIFLFLCFLG